MKKCSMCKKLVETDKYACDPCRKRRSMYHQRVNNAPYKKYEKTKNGFLMRVYRNMKSRVSGVQHKKYHLYAGKELFEKDVFYSWAFSSHTFHKLFGIWEKSNYERRLTPSVDRIDPKKGYTIENVEWVTHSENSRRSSITRKNHTSSGKK